MKIITTPNKCLIETAEPVVKFDKKLQKTIHDMEKTLNSTFDPVGVGLAAPQVGISKRIFLAKPKENGEIFVFINPQLIESDTEVAIPIFTNSPKVESNKPHSSKNKLLEGCLSVPNIWGNVSRKKEVKLAFQDVKGKRHVKKFSGFMSIIIQHELDHLEGILFTKHVMSQGEQLYRSHKNEHGEDVFEEVKL